MSATPSQAGKPDGDPLSSSSGPDAADAADMAIVRAIQSGTDAPSAWAILLNRYQDRLYAVCLRMIGNPDIAADLTQDAIVKIIQGLTGYDGRSKLSTWMIRVTMNTCLSYLRSQKLRKHASLDSLTGPGGPATHTDEGPYRTDAAAPAAPGSSGKGISGRFETSPQPSQGPREQVTELGPDQSVQLDEVRRRVIAALNLLSPDQRSILVLRDVQGLDYEQIADVLDVAVGTVKSRLFRARVVLRELIEASEEHD